MKPSVPGASAVSVWNCERPVGADRPRRNELIEGRPCCRQRRSLAPSSPCAPLPDGADQTCGPLEPPPRQAAVPGPSPGAALRKGLSGERRANRCAPHRRHVGDGARLRQERHVARLDLGDIGADTLRLLPQQARIDRSVLRRDDRPARLRAPCRGPSQCRLRAQSGLPDTPLRKAALRPVVVILLP